MNEKKIKIILAIGMWIPAIFFASGIYDNTYACMVMMSDGGDSYNRCVESDGKSFIIITVVFAFLPIYTTLYVLYKYLPRKEKGNGNE